jgi:hypothetical protein
MSLAIFFIRRAYRPLSGSCTKARSAEYSDITGSSRTPAIDEAGDPGAALAQTRLICVGLGAMRHADVAGLRVRLRCIDDPYGAPTRAPFS